MLASYLWLSLMAQASVPAPPPASVDCWQPGPSIHSLADSVVSLHGKDSQRIPLPPFPDKAVVVQIVEQGIDASIDLMDAQNRRLTRAESPVIRSGVTFSLVEPQALRPRTLVLNGKEHAEHQASVRVRVYAAAPQCVERLRMQSLADARYAAGHAAIATPDRQARESAPLAFAEAARLYEAIAALPGQSAKNLAAVQLTLASLHYYDLSKWTASAEWAAKAAASAEAAGEALARARAQAILASAWMEMRTAKTAAENAARLMEVRKLLVQLRDFHVRRHEDYEAALQINNIGLTYYAEARFEEALPLFTAVRATFKRQSEVPREALALQNIALCEWGLGSLPKALEHFAQALDLMDAKAHPDLFLIVINNLALTNFYAGNYDQALAIYQRALEFAQRFQEDSYRARSYFGIGITQYALGDRRLAGQFLRLALDVWKGELDVRGRTSALRALAVLEFEEKHFDEAIRLNLEALGLATSAGARARIQVKIAASHEAMGHRAQALEMLAPIIDAPPDDNALVQADARLERGRIRLSAGDLANAYTDLERALAVFRVLQSLSGEFDSRVALARVHARSGRGTQALQMITSALALGDEIGAQTANPEYRAALVQSLRPAQELMVDLLHEKYALALREGRKSDAQRVATDALAFADGTRAQSFDRIQAQRYELAGNDNLGRLISEREKLHRALADLRGYLSTREDRAAPQDIRARVLREDIARLRVELGNKNTEIARATAGAGRAGSTRGDRLPLVLSQVRPNQAFVEYWLGATEAYAWVVRERQVHWLKLANGAGIADSARQLHEAMRDFSVVPRDARIAASRRVNDAVIVPLTRFLEGADALTIAADGPLHVVPFAALRSSPGDRYLVQRFSIAFVPALRFVSTTDNAPAAHRKSDKALLVADPIYQRDDPRLPGAPSGLPVEARAKRPVLRDAADLRLLPRLSATAREAAAIQASLQGTQVVLLMGAGATRNSLLAQDLPSYRYIHIAAHGIIDTEIPRLSALILGDVRQSRTRGRSTRARGRPVDRHVRCRPRHVERLQHFTGNRLCRRGTDRYALRRSRPRRKNGCIVTLAGSR